MRKLRVGIVGCGGIANGKHLPAMKRNGNFEFVAFCDLIEERAQKAKEEYGTEDSKVYTDYNDLLKEDIEDVYVLTPNSVHAPVSIAAMEAGKNVMCEKPMAKTYDEAKAKLDAAFRGSGGAASGSSSETLQRREWPDGQIITLSTGTGILLFRKKDLK